MFYTFLQACVEFVSLLQKRYLILFYFWQICDDKWIGANFYLLLFKNIYFYKCCYTISLIFRFFYLLTNLQRMMYFRCKVFKHYNEFYGNGYQWWLWRAIFNSRYPPSRRKYDSAKVVRILASLNMTFLKTFLIFHVNF